MSRQFRRVHYVSLCGVPAEMVSILCHRFIVRQRSACLSYNIRRRLQASHELVHIRQPLESQELSSSSDKSNMSSLNSKPVSPGSTVPNRISSQCTASGSAPSRPSLQICKRQSTTSRKSTNLHRHSRRTLPFSLGLIPCSPSSKSKQP